MAEPVILAETTLSFEYNSALGAYAHVDSSLPFLLETGKRYTIEWDGIKYVRAAFAFEASDGTACIAAGNPIVAGETSNNDPFSIVCDTTNEILCYISTETAEAHTVAVSLVEGIILKDRNGKDVVYYGIETVTFDTTTEGKQQTYTKGVAVENLEIVPDFSGGDMAVTTAEGTLVKSAVVKKPDALKEENIRSGEDVGGIKGTLVPAPDGPYIEYTLNEAGEIIAAKMYGYTTIPRGCFAYMSYLESVDISNSPGISAIGNYAFYGCSALKSFVIPAGATSIGEYAFSGCSALTNIDIPNGVTSIGNRTFHNCKALTSINIPNSVTSIGNNAFASCSALASIDIPNSVISIGNNAFDASGLISCTIPDSVTSMGTYVFYNCSKLTSVTIGSGVTSIGNLAFYNCAKLTSVTIGSGVTSIGQQAFNMCSALTSITIPASVKLIDYRAFANCTALTSATFNTTSGWWVTQSSTATSGSTLSSSYLANKTTAATYLCKTYELYYWHRN